MFGRPSLMVTVTVVILGLATACSAAQEAGESSASLEILESPPPSAEQAESLEPSPEIAESATPSAAAQADDACSLVLDAAAAPPGTTGDSPVRGTLDDLRAEVESQAAGSPGRAAAEANLEAYEEMGLVERCGIIFGDAAGPRFASTALIFEAETGSAAYLDFLMEGCETGEVPASASVDAVIVCSFGVPTAYAVVTDGHIVQTISASAEAGSSVDPSLIDQAVALLEHIQMAP